jgi:hypothetical protein
MRFNTLVAVVSIAASVEAFQVRDLASPLSLFKRKDGGSTSSNSGSSNSGSSNSGPGGGGNGGGNKCPAVWGTISTNLTSLFLSGGQCNDDARAAIREAFHDCGTWNKAQGSTGGCDGSLILAPETGRPENNGLQDISAKLLARARAFNVGVADMIQFAGGKSSPTASLTHFFQVQPRH